MCRAIGLPAISSGTSWHVVGDLYLYSNLIPTLRLIVYKTNTPIALTTIITTITATTTRIALKQLTTTTTTLQQ